VEPLYPLKRFEDMKRTLILTLGFSLVAFGAGWFLTDSTPLHHDDWQWRYAVRLFVALIALFATVVMVWRLPVRQHLLIGIAGIPLLFSIPHSYDLYHGPGRIFGMTQLTPTGSFQEFEYDWLPYTDRILE
jgi:peptidoglycan/LPS O-acetylase OafA/YrhL